MKKSINPLMALLCLMIAILNQPAWADEQYKDVIAKLSKQSNAVLRYEEKYEAFYLDKALESRGELRFEPPDKLIKTVSEPESLMQEIEGNMVVVRWSNGKVEQFPLDQHRGLECMANTLRSILSGNTNFIEKTYEIEYSENEGHWRMILVPKEINVKNWIKNIVLLGGNGKLNQFTVTEVNGDYSSITLYE